MNIGQLSAALMVTALSPAFGQQEINLMDSFGSMDSFPRIHNNGFHGRRAPKPKTKKVQAQREKNRAARKARRKSR